MKTFDRMLLLALAFAVLVLIVTVWPAHAAGPAVV
jgi:hypothetical protein